MPTLQRLFPVMLSLYSSIAFAGPPFVTDDPEPVELHHWEVNYAYAKTWHDGSASAAVPSIDINYGLTSNIQLHAQPRYSRETAGNDRQRGFDNTEIGVKYRFYDQQQTNRHVMLGIYPIIQLPTGDKKLGESRGNTQALIPLWTQLDSGPWTFYGGAGYRINQYEESTNSWFFGGTTLYSISDKLRIGAELFHETKTSISETHTSGFNLGGIGNLSHDYRLLFSVGQALNNVTASNAGSSYLALQVIY